MLKKSKSENWNSKKRKFNIIVTKSSWLYKRIFYIKKFLKKYGHSVRIYVNHKKIKSSDVNLILSYYKIIPEAFLDKSKRNMVIHESDLPKGRGFAPMSWEVLKGKKFLTFSLFNIDKFNKAPDSGKIYYKEKFRLNGTELIDELRDVTLKVYKKLILKFLRSSTHYDGYIQKGNASFYRRRKLSDSEINFNKNIKNIFNLLRIVYNESYPAYFVYKKKKYFLNISKKKLKKIF